MSEPTPGYFDKPLPEPTRVSQPFWDGCARGELAVIRDAGHEVHREAPDEFADLALRFLSRGGRCTTTSATA